MKSFFAALACIWCFHATAQTGYPIGTWVDHLSYRNASFVEQSSDLIFCGSNVSLYSVDKDFLSFDKISKCTGLSDIGFSTIRYDQTREQLVIAYENSNIDLWTPSKVVNIPDIKRKNIVGDKSIYSIDISGDFAYLSCGFGIVVLDLTKNEIKDTYYIGPDGNALKVNQTAIGFDKIFAATENGLYMADVNDPSLGNFQVWQRLDSTSLLPVSAARHVIATPNGVYATFGGEIFRYDGTQWQLVYNSAGAYLYNIGYFGDRLYVCEQSKIVLIDNAGSVVHSIQANGFFYNPNDMLIDHYGRWWITDYDRGLSMMGDNTQSLYPNGPFSSSAWRVEADNGNAYVAAGAIVSGGLIYNGDGFFVYENNEWKSFNHITDPVLADSLLDFASITHNAVTGITYAGAFDGAIGGGGLVERKSNNELTVYKQNYLLNNPAFVTNYPVYDVTTDLSGNVWLSNPNTIRPLHVLTPAGDWLSFQLQNLSNTDPVADLYPDKYNQVWIIMRNNGIEVYGYGTDLESQADDKYRRFTTGTGSGNLPSNTVLDMVIDHNDEAWIGTDKGIAVIYCVSNATADGCDAQQIIVSGSDSIAGYLLESERINAIAVDAGNRKWIGTENGVWLLSSDGLTELQHFTIDNSPLFSNSILDIDVDDATGLVYIATAEGLMAYQSDATVWAAAEKKCEATVYPNPVKHDYSGPIAIRNVPYNSTVKITDAAGGLVYQTISNGGTAVWDGFDYNGRKAASGVYYVTSVSSDGQSTCRAKLVFIN